MPKQVVNGATLMCSFGTGPSNLVVVRPTNSGGSGQPAANINDHIGMTNIMPFIMCTTPSNPAVAAAKAPVPCTPVVPAPWAPGSSVYYIAGQPAVHQACTCNCVYTGVITVTNPGQVILDILR